MANSRFPAPLPAGQTPVSATLPRDLTVVVLGGAGELASQRVLPALDRLRREVGGELQVVLVDRRPPTAPCRHLFVTGDATDSELYRDLFRRFERKPLFFYLALPGHTQAAAVRALGGARPRAVGRWLRLAIEKPVGGSREGAAEVRHLAESYFARHEVHLVDHYLGKPGVRRLRRLRALHPELFRAWRAKRLDHVQVHIAETEGMGHSGPTFERCGILGDMVQSHVVQVIGALAGVFGTDGVAPVENIRRVHLASSSGFELGQYGCGSVAHGYRRETGVSQGSTADTFVAMRLGIDAPGWRGVPVYVRVGKRLEARRSFVALRFLDPAPHWVRISLDGGDPYRVILRAIAVGDRRYEPSMAATMEGWRFVRSLEREHARRIRHRYPNYAAGSTGPESARRLIERDGRDWFNEAEATLETEKIRRGSAS